MTHIRMDVKPEVISEYIRKSGLDVNDLKHFTNLGSIEHWLNGDKQPTFNQLNDLSKKLRVPLGYLILDEAIDDTPPILDYRTVDSLQTDQNSRELIDVIKTVETQQEFVADYRQQHGYDQLAFVNYFPLNESIENLVEFSRELLSVEMDWQKHLKGKTPFKYFREKFSDIGILVFINGIVGQNTHRRLDLNEFRAFVIVDQYAPAIFINTNDSQNGQLFSMMHEFAHILFGKQEVYNVGVELNDTPSDIEIKCNHFASEMLVPNQLFIEKWNHLVEQDTNKKIGEMADYFKVSETVIARKALDYQYVTKDVYNNIAEYAYKNYKDSRNKQREKNDTGNYWNTLKSKMDLKLFSTVKKSVYEGDIQYTDALNLLGISRRAFDYLDDYESGKGSGE